MEGVDEREMPKYLLLSCDAITKAAAVLQQAFTVDEINHDLYKLLDNVVNKESSRLLQMLNSDGVTESFPGSESVNEMRTKIAEIKRDTESSALLYPRDRSFERGIQSLIAGSWIKLESWEQDEELRQLRKTNALDLEAKANLRNILSIRKLRLPFYEGVDLFEAEVYRTDSSPGCWAYLRTAERTLILDGTSNPIRSLNS